jgi:1-acyl-sn-glycerol-3-phosphate acyltransferase
MRPFYRFSYTLVGLHLQLFHGVRIEGRENIPDEGCLIVGNHASYLDPTTIGWAIGREIYFLGRRDLFKPPVLNWLLPMCNVLPIDRDGNDISGLRGIIKRLKGGQSVLVFPEGTRTENGALQPAEPGAGLLAVKAKVRVLPTRVFGTYEAWPRGGKGYRREPLRVVVGRPYWPALPAVGKPDYQAISNEMMAKIAELT